MNLVEKFISENQHQLGYIMQEASRQWIEKDSIGALTVGECNIFVQKYGQYHEILEKMQRYEKALKDIRNVSTLDEYASPVRLLHVCYEIAKEADGITGVK